MILGFKSPSVEECLFRLSCEEDSLERACPLPPLAQSLLKFFELRCISGGANNLIIKFSINYLLSIIFYAYTFSLSCL